MPRSARLAQIVRMVKVVPGFGEMDWKAYVAYWSKTDKVTPLKPDIFARRFF